MLLLFKTQSITCIHGGPIFVVMLATSSFVFFFCFLASVFVCIGFPYVCAYKCDGCLFMRDTHM